MLGSGCVLSPSFSLQRAPRRRGLEAEAVIAGFEYVAAVGEAVEPRHGHRCIAEDGGPFAVQRLPRTREVLDSLRQFRGRLPANERLGRDDAHSR